MVQNNDLTNLLTAIEGKIRRIKKAQSMEDVQVETEKLGTYNEKALNLLVEYREKLRNK